MDIFIIKTTDVDELHKNLLLEFKKKDITNPQKLNQHCLSYLMLDRILREVYKLDEREIIFAKGKPHLKSKLKHFSISHSNDLITIAFSDFNCGIDIEKNTNRDFEKIAKRLNFTANSQQDFYVQWTKFEAEYKLNAASKSLKTFQIDDYTLTAVSENLDENYELFIQTN